MALSVAQYIPIPPVSGFHLGPLFIHFYGLMYVVGITLAVIIVRRRWRAAGGDVALVTDVATWAVPAGLVGARIYFDIRDIRPPGLLALYVAGYSGYRIFEETIRIDSSAYFLGLRLNMYVAIVMTLAGIGWFVFSQRQKTPGPAQQVAAAQLPS